MFTFKEITEARELIIHCWKEDGKKVVESAFNEHRKINMEDFLSYCKEDCTSELEKLLRGMKIFYPKTYEAVPDSMGLPAYLLVKYTLLLCGVDIKG